MRLPQVISISFISVLFFSGSSVIAQQHAEHAAQSSDHTGHMRHAGYTEEQQAEINHMHHELDEDQRPWKEQEARALKELNEMTIREDVRLAAVYAKIDELMAAKNQIMRLRYAHLIEMRKILTDEQKVSYDERVLQRSEVR